MSTNSTVKAYYIFMFMLPLLFYTGIADIVLLPRQLFLSAFTLLLAGAIWKAAKDNNSLKIETANLAMVIYLLLAAVISFINAAVLSESLYILSKLSIVISFSILTGFLLKRNVINSRHIITAGIIFGCVSIATALPDIIEKTLRGQHLLREVQHTTGGFANKNLLSSILFLCLPFFMIGMHERRLKAVSCIAIVLALFILVILRTRIALIATFVFFAIIATFYLRAYFKRKFWLFVGGCIIIGSLIFFTLGFFGVFGELYPSVDVKKYFDQLLNTHTLNERLLFWQNSLEMFREHPFGVGLGNWPIYVPKYGLGKFISFEIVNGINTLQRPHNDFLGSLCETGVLGFAVYVSIFGFLIYKSFTLIKTAADNYEKWLSIYLFSGIIGFVMISFFDFPMERIEHLVILMLLFALVIHQYAIKIQTTFTVSIKKKYVMLFVMLGIGFSFTIAFIRFAGEKNAYEMDAARKNGNSEDVVFFAERANSIVYKIDSKAIPLEWYKGVAKFSKQQYAESEACFKKAYALTPYNIHVINNLASCYEVNGKRKDAITMYLKALRISPGFEEARLNLAAVYFNNKQYDKAFNTIDFCAVETRDPKYKMFLPPILKGKAEIIIKGIQYPISIKIRNSLANLQDFSQLYYDSKKNNITFEKQITNYLKE
jgi:O-antigen ligase